VRGHDGNVGNEHVDALANAAIDAMLANGKESPAVIGNLAK
jgi:ribonuclease HI